MNLIPTSKHGDCSQCGDINVPCAKVGKNLFCIYKCHRINKAKAQAQKATLRNSVRSLGTFQKQEGILDSIQELTIDLDRVYSRWLRIASAGPDLKCECFTCSTKRPFEQMQCGHMISRSHLGLRWEPSNTKVQCPTCNVTLKGNLGVFKRRLDQENSGTVEWLEETSRQVYSPSRDELKQKLIHYQQKLRLVESKIK